MPGPKLFFIDSKNIVDNQVAISDTALKHITKALRLGKGDRIWLGDERKKRYLIELTEVDYKKATGRILETREVSDAPAVEIILLQSVLKGEKMDILIQKASELGVSKVIPVITERTIVKFSESRISSKEKRWQSIAREASQQSGRWDVPEIAPITDFKYIFEKIGKVDLGLILWEDERENRLKTVLRRYKSDGIKRISAFIGPEGGFAEKEIALARENGFISVSMGDLILRAETAAIIIMGIIQYEFNNIG